MKDGMPARLKQLDLHGYKTFASRTEFEFAPSITAIIGPNGSGKSNIADAIRWVLGEQAFSLLRGKKTEDMIFSGSENRPQAGMASVLMTFDNSEGWLPIDFSEVSIGRRAYRDGRNEYQVNGQKVRLKDIAELLASSGLGERTYTIIGQGLVDSALSLRAEDRRALFEEAAGIGLYRQKREDSLRRMETTRRNLERAEDILAELGPRLRSLERQAKRARQYDQVKTDLKELLRVWYGYHWHLAQKELQEARLFARHAAEELAVLQHQQQELDKELSQGRAHVNSLRAQLNSWHHDSAGLHSERESLGLHLAVADERARALIEAREQTLAELILLEADLAAHEDRFRSAQQGHTAILAEIVEVEERARSAQADLEERETRKNELASREAESRRSLFELTDRAAEIRARRSQFEERRDQLAVKRRELVSVRETAEVEAASTLQALEACKVAHEQALVYQKEAESRRTAQEQRIAEQQAQLALLAGRASELGAEAARLQARGEVLDQAEHELEGYAAGARTVLALARDGRLSGAPGALSQKLDVAPEYELAVAAALGQYLEAVTLNSNDDLDAVLEVLGRPESGRAALLPLADLIPGQLLEQPADAEALGVASQLVRSAVELRPAIDLLLGRFVVVRNWKAARRVLPLLPADASAVTLAGEVFHPGGPILAGRSEAQANVLSRQRERRELASHLLATRSAIDELARSRESLENTLDHFREELSSQTGELADAEAEVREARRARDLAHLAAERLTQQAELYREQHAELDSQAMVIQAALNSLESEDRELIELQSRRQAELAEIAQRLAEIAEDDPGAQAAHWQTRSAVARRAAAEGQSRLEDLQRACEAALASVNDRRDRAARLAEELGKLTGTASGDRQRETRLAGEIELLRLKIEPAERGLSEGEAELERLEGMEAAARTNLHAAERRHAHAQLELSRREDALNHLRRQIEDDFGLVEFDYLEDISGPTPLPLGDLVESLDYVAALPEGLEESLQRRRLQLRRMGAINPEAPVEYDEVKERHDFLTTQLADLNEAQARLHEVIAELDAMMERDFRQTFDRVAEEFSQVFSRLFAGGSARLVLTDPDHLTTSGIDIQARLPGRRTQSLALLSGGERSLTASALVFALLKVAPPPFCLLDEVDAALDETNIGRFCDLLKELSGDTQFIVITHNRGTVQAAEMIYGITMDRDTASQAIGLKLDEVAHEMAVA